MVVSVAVLALMLGGTLPRSAASGCPSTPESSREPGVEELGTFEENE